MVSKIYIVGPVGSGKSTLARRLAKDFSFPCCELDGLVHVPDVSSPTGNRKRTPEERDALFHSVLSQSRWVMEDTGRACFEEGLRQADSILLLEPARSIRKRRILIRWIKQNLHIEQCRYRPSVSMLKSMYKWSDNYDSGADGVKNRLVPYDKKIAIMRNENDFRAYMKRFFT